MSVSVLNTDASISGKTLTTNETNETISGVKVFSNDVKVNSTKRVYLDGGTDTYIVESAADTFSLVTAGTERFQVTSTGVISVLSGQIKFPATQSASADANTLDDYEEGSWTPTLIGSGGQSGQVYGAQVGRYVKIGKQVIASGRIQLTTLGTITGTAQIGGLPFTVENVTSMNPVASVFFLNLTSTLVSLLAIMNPNTTNATLYKLAAAAASYSGTVQADYSNTSDIIFTLVYRADG